MKDKPKKLSKNAEEKDKGIQIMGIKKYREDKSLMRIMGIPKNETTTKIICKDLYLKYQASNDKTPTQDISCNTVEL